MILQDDPNCKGEAIVGIDQNLGVKDFQRETVLAFMNNVKMLLKKLKKIDSMNDEIDAQSALKITASVAITSAIF